MNGHMNCPFIFGESLLGMVMRDSKHFDWYGLLHYA